MNRSVPTCSTLAHDQGPIVRGDGRIRLPFRRTRSLPTIRNDVTNRRSQRRSRSGHGRGHAIRGQVFDVVISNGVLNLSPLKEHTYREIYRVLKPSGRLQFADIVLREDLASEIVGSLDAWSD